MNHIVIVKGTTRPESKSELVSMEIERILSSHDTEIKVVSYTDFDLAHDGARDPKWDEISENANGFILVVPEYNRGYPGSLKQLLDAQHENYLNKKVLSVGVSAGPFGGARGVENLLPVLRELGLISTKRSAYIMNAGIAFDESGKLVDEAQAKHLKESVDSFVAELN